MITTHQSFTELRQIHQEIEDVFFRHQEALLKGDYPIAKELLKGYEEFLLHHMKEEEEILLPLYRQRAGQMRGGDAEVFVLEHKKIVEWLGRLKMRLSRLWPVPVDKKEVIALLDDEAQFKKFMEHHSLREDRIFYPELDRIVTEAERTHLLRLLTFSLEDYNPQN